MILDAVKNSNIYEGLHPLFARAFEWLRATDLSTVPDGITKIEGDDLFVNMMHSADLKEPDKALLEVHDRYIDIQVVLSGRETFGWAERGECTGARGEMDTEKDVLLFDGKPSLNFTLQAGEFCIFFPTDGHAPMIGESGSKVSKCILKVRVK